MLASYSTAPNAAFWENFPAFYPVPKAQNRINLELLEEMVSNCWDRWGSQQRRIAKKTLNTLREGASTELSHSLPGMNYPNAKSAIEYGEMLTDSIAYWVKTGMVAGPFEAPPLSGFRCNPLMAVAQKTKVRPVLNLSAPLGGSFNAAIVTTALRKLQMSTAKEFGYAVLRAGRFSEMAKYDMVDAFKLIPGLPDQWRMFGFSWLGKYFFDVTTVFGSGSAPANFDGLPETVANITEVMGQVPKSGLFRQLDDSPYVSAAGSGNTEKFAKAYVDLCQRLRIPLAEMDPDREKAFGPGCTGSVLGIKFDSATLSWSLPVEKAESIVQVIDRFLMAATCNLFWAQKLHGKLNDFAQMMPFAKGFRFNILELLCSFEGNENGRRLVKTGLKRDLFIWKNCVLAAIGGLPLCSPPTGAPLSAMCFVSDAAGAAFEWTEGRSANVTTDGDRGAASVGYTSGKIFFCGGGRWPVDLLTKRKDRCGKFFGTKSTFLESVGLLIPFVTIPSKLRSRHVLLQVDNLNVVYAWEKRNSRSDAETSAVIRALHTIEAWLPCKIYVQHVARVSTIESALADRLSRRTSTTAKDKELISRLGWHSWSGALTEWLAHPRVDWDLGQKLIVDIEKILK